MTAQGRRPFTAPWARTCSARGVGLARRAAYREHANPFVLGNELALLAGTHADHHSRLQDVPLASGLHYAAPAEGDVELLLAILGMVVVGVAVVAGGHVDHVDAEGREAEIPPHVLEAPAHACVDLADFLRGHVSHRFLLGLTAQQRRGAYPCGCRRERRSPRPGRRW